MDYRVIETHYGPPVRPNDWASDDAKLVSAGGMLQAFSPASSEVRWRFYPVGGGGDVAMRLAFRIARMGEGGGFTAHTHRSRSGAPEENGFRLVCRPNATELFLKAELLWAQAIAPDAAQRPRELSVATLADAYEVTLDGDRVAKGRMRSPAGDNEGVVALSLRDVDVEVLSLAEEFIEHDVAFPAWRKAEALYREPFSPESLAAEWVCNGEPPTCEDGAFVFQPMSVCVLKQPFEGPIAVESVVTPVPDFGRFTAGVTDAIFMWMMDRPDGDLLDYMRALPDAELSNYVPLPLYWVDFGGTNNITTRLRKNPGRHLVRQFTDRARLLQRDRTYRIVTVQNASMLEFWVDGEPMIRAWDPEPLTRGHVGFRAYVTPLRVSEMTVWRIEQD